MRNKNHFVDQLFMQKRDLMAVLTKWLGDSVVNALVPWEICSFHEYIVDLLCGFMKIDEKGLNMRKNWQPFQGKINCFTWENSNIKKPLEANFKK